jgi:hypothetical protein
MTPMNRYALNFAKVAYHADSVDALDSTDWHHIHRIFAKFYPQYHEHLAEYPIWVTRLANITPRDLRRCKQFEREGKWPMFLFSDKRIEAYLTSFVLA